MEEKIYLGLDSAVASGTIGTKNLPVKTAIEGVNGENLKSISDITGAQVSLRGLGSGCIEPLLGTEAPDPIHVLIKHLDAKGFQTARELVQYIVQQVQADFPGWVNTATVTQLTQAAAAHQLSTAQAAAVNPLAAMYPGQVTAAQSIYGNQSLYTTPSVYSQQLYAAQAQAQAQQTAAMDPQSAAAYAAASQLYAAQPGAAATMAAYPGQQIAYMQQGAAAAPHYAQQLYAAQYQQAAMQAMQQPQQAMYASPYQLQQHQLQQLQQAQLQQYQQAAMPSLLSKLSAQQGLAVRTPVALATPASSTTPVIIPKISVTAESKDVINKVNNNTTTTTTATNMKPTVVTGSTVNKAGIITQNLTGGAASSLSTKSLTVYGSESKSVLGSFPGDKRKVEIPDAAADAAAKKSKPATNIKWNYNANSTTNTYNTSDNTRAYNKCEDVLRPADTSPSIRAKYPALEKSDKDKQTNKLGEKDGKSAQSNNLEQPKKLDDSVLTKTNQPPPQLVSSVPPAPQPPPPAQPPLHLNLTSFNKIRPSVGGAPPIAAPAGFDKDKQPPPTNITQPPPPQNTGKERPFYTDTNTARPPPVRYNRPPPMRPELRPRLMPPRPPPPRPNIDNNYKNHDNDNNYDKKFDDAKDAAAHDSDMRVPYGNRGGMNNHNRGGPRMRARGGPMFHGRGGPPRGGPPRGGPPRFSAPFNPRHRPPGPMGGKGDYNNQYRFPNKEDGDSGDNKNYENHSDQRNDKSFAGDHYQPAGRNQHQSSQFYNDSDVPPPQSVQESPPPDGEAKPPGPRPPYQPRPRGPPPPRHMGPGGPRLPHPNIMRGGRPQRGQRPHFRPRW